MAAGDAVTRNTSEAVAVEPVSTLGDPFDFDASQYLGDRVSTPGYTGLVTPGVSYTPPFFGQAAESQVGYNPLDEAVTLGQAEEVAGQFMSGQLPQDVLDQIRRSAAERSVQGGFGGSQFARNLTLRDIGKTSLETMEMGSKLGLAASEARSKRGISDRERELQAQTFNTQYAEQTRQFDTATAQFGAQFAQQQRQFEESAAQFAANFAQEVQKWNDQFALSMRSADDAGTQLVMSALSAQSASRSFRVGQENQLILANSTDKIPGLQANLDSMAGLFDNINRQYQELINLYTNP